MSYNKALSSILNSLSNHFLEFDYSGEECVEISKREVLKAFIILILCALLGAILPMIVAFVFGRWVPFDSSDDNNMRLILYLGGLLTFSFPVGLIGVLTVTTSRKWAGLFSSATSFCLGNIISYVMVSKGLGILEGLLIIFTSTIVAFLFAKANLLDGTVSFFKKSMGLTFIVWLLLRTFFIFVIGNSTFLAISLEFLIIIVFQGVLCFYVDLIVNHLPKFRLPIYVKWKIAYSVLLSLFMLLLLSSKKKS